MSDKKNIERFFQEKFKDFEVNPEPMAWANISERINNKKNKKRIFPFWITFGGIAAGLIIGYFVNNNFFNNNMIKNNTIIIENYDNQKITNINDTNSKIIVATNKNDSLIINKNNEINKKSPTLNNNQNNKIATSSIKNKPSIKKLIYNQNDDENKVAVATNKKINKKSLIITNNEDSKIVNSFNKKNLKKGNLISNIKYSENKIAVATNNKNNKKSSKLKNNSNSEIAASLKKNKSDRHSNENNLTLNETIEEKPISNNDKIVVNKTIETNILNDSKIENSSISINQEKQIITENEIKKPDSIENPLDKILKEKENKEKKKTLVVVLSKWKIRSNVAPIFMNASNGSPIHDIFIDNEKNYENNLSIGLGADYAISRKFSIRAGINKFEMGYNTNEVGFYSDLTAINGISASNSIQTINLKDEFHNIVIGDKKSRVANIVTPPTQTPEEFGVLNQKFGYLEFPVEVSYKLFDKRFGITLITGLSTLLLNNNEVSLVSNNKTMILGGVNNLNKIHYSTNLGVGFKYSFLKSFEANIEPTFKYQINSFNKNSGGFNPYFLGIYTGISYKL